MKNKITELPVNSEVPMHAASPTDEIFLITARWPTRGISFLFSSVFCHRFKTGHLLQESDEEQKNIKIGD